MRSRQEIKAIGRARFTDNYWQCVGAVFLVGLLISAVAGVFTFPAIFRSFSDFFRAGSMLNGSIDYTVSYRTGFSPLSASGTLITAIISGPLSIGLCFFFISVILDNTKDIDIGTPFRSAFTGFGRKLGGYWWMMLFTFLWSLLFVIPGIIKAFSYAMTPYILADCPNVRATDALKLSKRIMAGHKGQLFVLYLSFIGWGILSGLTLGLLSIFYVQPYLNSTLATYYLEVREAALDSGAITMGQLEGTEAV